MTEPVNDIWHVGEKRAKQLQNAGYQTSEDLQAASRDEIMAIEGIGEATARRIEEQFEDKSE